MTLEPQTEIETDRDAKMRKNEEFLKQLMTKGQGAGGTDGSADGSGSAQPGEDAGTSPFVVAPATPSPGQGPSAPADIATPESPAVMHPAAGRGGKGKKRSRPATTATPAKTPRAPRRSKTAKAATPAAPATATPAAAAPAAAAATAPPAMPPHVVSPVVEAAKPPLQQDAEPGMHAPPPRVMTLPPLGHAVAPPPVPQATAAAGRTASLAAVTSRASIPTPGHGQ